ncbi:MAG: class D sortase [Streptococcaceae bacterium]|jgi:sortase A|nr:class D sortase [Streptococcaceae bacterium]
MKRIGQAVCLPILTLVLGYLLIYVVGKPVIDVASSALTLFMLADTPVQSKTVHAEEITLVTQTHDKPDEIPSSQVPYPVGGQQYGQVIIESLAINEPLYFDDNQEILRDAVGQYIGSVMPGQIGTTMIGGHNYPDRFGRLLGIQENMLIQVQTTWGLYTYKVTSMDIRNYRDPQVIELLNQRNDRQLILYTCYPVTMIGFTDERIFVFATFVSGPIINPDL